MPRCVTDTMDLTICSEVHILIIFICLSFVVIFPIFHHVFGRVSMYIYCLTTPCIIRQTEPLSLHRDRQQIPTQRLPSVHRPILSLSAHMFLPALVLQLQCKPRSSLTCRTLSINYNMGKLILTEIYRNQ